MCAEITRGGLPMAVFDTEEVRRGAFSVNSYKPLIWYSIRHFCFLLIYWNSGAGSPLPVLLSSEIFNLFIQAVNRVKYFLCVNCDMNAGNYFVRYCFNQSVVFLCVANVIK